MARETDPPGPMLTRRAARIYGPYPVASAVTYLQESRGRYVPETWQSRSADRVQWVIRTGGQVKDFAELFGKSAEAEHTITDLILRICAVTIAAILTAWATVRRYG